MSFDIQKIPPAFICTYSKTVMEKPVLSLCGHLFEKKFVFPDSKICPIDKYKVSQDSFIPCEELQKTIAIWKKHYASISYSQTITKSSEDSCPSSVQQAFGKLDLTEQKEDPQQPRKKAEIRPYKIIKDAHNDDIHGFVLISPKMFISGSKDTSLKMWDTEGKALGLLEQPNKGYKYWITALSSFNNGLWASGTRDGNITIWDHKGCKLTNIKYIPNQYSKCKERNKSRINCITQANTGDEAVIFYTGTPRYIQLWDGENGKFLKGYKASINDWVYCIEVLENQDLLLVIGANLEYWKMETTPPKKESLIQEAKQEGTFQRPHISAITRLEHNKNLLSSALFDGSVKITDIITKKMLMNYQEHIGRVWSVVNIYPQVFATSADDKTIKIWDARQARSIFTIGGNPGRVSSLLKLTDITLISGSCPDDIAQGKANISFWDIRQLK